MAGIYARVDVERGVHKAPANEVVRNITKIAQEVTKREQDLLNPRNINVLRFFPGRGNRVWGARVVTSDAAWKYINVRGSSFMSKSRSTKARSGLCSSQTTSRSGHASELRSQLPDQHVA
jgi:phage tail sheath protein FI